MLKARVKYIKMIFLLLSILIISESALAQQPKRSYNIVFTSVSKVEYNKDYFEYYWVGLESYNDTTKTLNWEFVLLKDYPKSTWIKVESYESMDSQFKKGVYVMDMDLCDYFDSDTLVVEDMKSLSNKGMECPIPTGFHEMKNYLVNTDRYPSELPGENWMFSLTLYEKHDTKSQSDNIPKEDIIVNYKVFVLIERDF
ncbi:unnamed protein product [Timema podura]|uniref:Uncharacterized protein n=1 Tax=Timema podura TaxID=61482 RepID=A0ABN7NC69_TIMPD|nr:unnamed protein product [Timema podura]